jgi:hypothetical protein
MPSLAFLAPAISLAVCLIPVFLLRRKAYARAQDYFVSSDHTPPGVIQNSSIAYALKMAAFGPLFAWGASGDLWPAIIGSAFFGLGSYLIYVLRRPMLAFLGNALSGDRSITISEFIAQRHGNDPRVRLLASGLMAFALTGLIVCETIGVATILKPVLSDNMGLSYMFTPMRNVKWQNQVSSIKCDQNSILMISPHVPTVSSLSIGPTKLPRRCTKLPSNNA